MISSMQDIHFLKSRKFSQKRRPLEIHLGELALSQMRFMNVSTANPFSVLFTQMTFQSIPLVVLERKPFQSPGSIEQQQKTIDCR